MNGGKETEGAGCEVEVMFERANLQDFSGH